MSKQWGHGFHAGVSAGEKWGEMIGNGKWETELCDLSTRLVLIANALRLPVEFQHNRTDTWWKLYVSAVAKQIEEVAMRLPGTLTSVYEFEKDIPAQSADGTPKQNKNGE